MEASDIPLIVLLFCSFFLMTIKNLLSVVSGVLLLVLFFYIVIKQTTEEYKDEVEK